MGERTRPYFTKFEYLYRDASNFKAYGCVTLKGLLTTEEREDIVARLEGGEFFIAEQVGITPLYEGLYALSGGATGNDHCWHEFDRFSEHAETADGDQDCGTVGELLFKFRSVSRWDLRLSPHVVLA